MRTFVHDRRCTGYACTHTLCHRCGLDGNLHRHDHVDIERGGDAAQVEYGTTANYGMSSSLDSSLALTHSATLAGLAPDTVYHYRVRSVDAAGNSATSADATFTTGSVQISLPSRCHAARHLRRHYGRR